ncbi:hypothetical protein FBQ96_09185 [Nitrospirales bacterium NOB]|jgi:hypothetical protein|nr:hypothetical protein [Anaerolineales bacterium]MDL1889737.1 hypothetical protein [Nitrospirales bacterium NOB]
MNEINPTKLHAELEKAGIPIEGVSSDGRIDFLPIATAEQMALADEILKRHDPIDYEAKRWEEYPDLRRMVLALLLDGEELEAVRAAVLAVNAKYPIPKSQ